VRAAGPIVLALDISRLAGQPISNGAVIAVAVALGFLGCDMARRSRLLAGCVDQREPSRYSAAGLGQWWSPVDSRRRRGKIHRIRLRGRMYPGSFGKAPDDQSGVFTFLGIKTIPAVYANRRGPRSLKDSENVCQLIFAFLTLRRRSVLRTSLIERCLRSAESFFMSHPFAGATGNTSDIPPSSTPSRFAL
jgi:hypothetical protein